MNVICAVADAVVAVDVAVAVDNDAFAAVLVVVAHAVDVAAAA